MASEIRVNKINSRTGVGTITLSPTGVDFTGIATVATLKATTGIVTTLSATGNATVGGTLGVTGDVDIADKIVHTGDTNTAIRFPAADTIAAETGGSERLRVDSSGDVHIGDSSSNANGHGLLSLTQNASAAFNALVIQQGNTAFTATDGLHVGIDANVDAYFKLFENRDFIFYTGTTNTEKLRIDSTGSIGVGTDSPTSQSGKTLHLHNGGGQQRLHLTTNNSGSEAGKGLDIILEHNTDGDAHILNHNTDGDLKLGAGDAERIRILSGGGLTFNADTAQANALDDYEEGTWTPTVSSAGSVTGEDAKYTKIGNLVHVYGKLTSFTNRSSSNTIVVTSLPYTASTNQAGGSMFARYADRTAYTVYVYSNKIEFYSIGSGNFTSLQHSHLNNDNAVIYFQATYNVA